MADSKDFILFIKSWTGITDYAFLYYSELFMINDAYVFEKIWIENLNLAPLPCDCIGSEGLRLEALNEPQSLIISVGWQKILVWCLDSCTIINVHLQANHLQILWRCHTPRFYRKECCVNSGYYSPIIYAIALKLYIKAYCVRFHNNCHCDNEPNSWWSLQDWYSQHLRASYCQFRFL